MDVPPEAPLQYCKPHLTFLFLTKAFALSHVFQHVAKPQFI
jgi:hypothetical protein